MKPFFSRVLDVLQLSDPGQKMHATTCLHNDWSAGMFQDTDFAVMDPDVHQLQQPGRPEFPSLVSPRQLPRRSVHTETGRAALLHSFAHIEFNAINLALDAVHRFRDLPAQYYGDWIKVAAEESYHFTLLRNHLSELGYDYGDFDAHNGLWEMACRTEHNPLVRMAIIPRLMEARGLDVTPGIIEKFQSVGESRAVEILSIILKDEIGHVECGSRWFYYLCDRGQLPRQETFERLMRQYGSQRLKSPLNREARIQAGFNDAELQYLEGLQ